MKGVTEGGGSKKWKIAIAVLICAIVVAGIIVGISYLESLRAHWVNVLQVKNSLASTTYTSPIFTITGSQWRIEADGSFASCNVEVYGANGQEITNFPIGSQIPVILYSKGSLYVKLNYSSEFLYIPEMPPSWYLTIDDYRTSTS